jgi:asparagine synthase (glutamine-hydrolysing)
MCGIAGIIQKNPHSFHAEQLHRMAEALAHRGPDGHGYWQDEDHKVLFGHRRLSIIDLSPAGHQPMHCSDRYVLMHNGEIYNYIELREELQQLGYHFYSNTDTEVIAAAYDRWQDQCVDHFDGMFAFCLWDKKEKSFFAARDRFGEKPFYYTLDRNCFLFASEIRSFWAAGIDKIPNRKLIFNFLTIGYTDNPSLPEETFFENILRLPPACWLRYHPDSEELIIENYWDIDLEIVNEKITAEEATQKFTALLHQSIQRRIRSDVPVGSSLSGGLDSSSIAAICSSMGSSVMSHQCFTASFEGFERDETSFAKQVADQFQLKQHIVSLGPNGLLDDLEKLCAAQEEPFASSSVYAQYKVFELARSQGITVLLDGQGADETLAGYHRYYKWYWQELYRKRKLKKSAEIPATLALGINENFNWKNKVAAWFPAFASVVMERQYLLHAIRQEDLDRDFVKTCSGHAYYTPPEHFDLNGVLYFNTRTHGLEELLRMADRNSMAHSIETRMPFLSHKLVEFVFSLPAELKIKNGRTKWILRNAMKDKLPENICWRRDKIGFETPQKQWMQHPQVKDAILESKKILVKENILKPSVLQKNIIPMDAYEADNYDWRYFSAAILFR